MIQLASLSLFEVAAYHPFHRIGDEMRVTKERTMNWFREENFLTNKGVVAIYVAICLVLFIGIAALAVDVRVFNRVARTEAPKKQLMLQRLQEHADWAELSGMVSVPVRIVMCSP